MNLSAFRPVFRPYSAAASIQRVSPTWQKSTTCVAPQNTGTVSFSSTAQLQKRAKKGPGNDPRISTSLPHLISSSYLLEKEEKKKRTPHHHRESEDLENLAVANIIMISSKHPLPPNPPPNPTPPALLPHPLPPPLDHPPRLAPVPAQAALGRGARARAPVYEYAGRVRAPASAG